MDASSAMESADRKQQLVNVELPVHTGSGTGSRPGVEGKRVDVGEMISSNKTRTVARTDHVRQTNNSSLGTEKKLRHHDHKIIEKVTNQIPLPTEAMQAWPPRFHDIAVERRYLSWRRKTNFMDLWITSLAILLLIGSFLVFSISEQLEEDKDEQRIYLFKTVFAVISLVVAICTLLLAPSNADQICYLIGLGCSGGLLAFSTAFKNNKLDLFLGVETILSFMGAVTALGTVVTYVSVSIANAVTVGAYFILAVVFLKGGENALATMHSLVTLVVVTIVLHIISYESEIGSRQTFYKRLLLWQATQKQNKDVRNLRLERKELMINAFSSMLKRFDLGKVEEVEVKQNYESAAEELIKTLNELCSLKKELGKNPIALRILKDVRRIVLRSGGDLYQPLREDLDALQDSEQSDMVQVLTQHNRMLRVVSNVNEGEKYRMLSPRRNFNSISSAMGSAEDQSYQHLYNRIDDFDFDVFDVMGPTKNKPLTFVVLALFGKHELVSKFSVDLKKLRSFCNVIEKGYISSNPYHNEIHGADVTRSCHYLLNAGGVFKVMTPLETMAAIIASCIHDFQHPGVTNDFLIRSSGALAITYNDQSVLENHHVAAAFQYLTKPEYDFLEHLTGDEWKEFRKIVITMVLATDLSRHKENLDKLKLRATHINNMLWPRTQAIQSSLGGYYNPKQQQQQHLRSLSVASGSSVNTAIETDEKEDAADRLMLMKMALKASDLGHSMKPLRQHIKWSERIKDEFFLEGDQAKKLGMQVKPLFDRNKNRNMGKSQAGFIRFLVKPLFQGLIPLLRLEDPILKQIESNLTHWNKSDQAFKTLESKKEAVGSQRRLEDGETTSETKDTKQSPVNVGRRGTGNLTIKLEIPEEQHGDDLAEKNLKTINSI